MKHYDHSVITARLTQIDKVLRPLFAVTIAERFLPALQEYVNMGGKVNGALVTDALNIVWQVAEGHRPDVKEVQTLLDRCMEAVRVTASEETETAFYAQEAITCIAYALRAILSDDPQEAAWAAQCGYEAVDHYVIEQLALDVNREGSSETIQSHPVVQRELDRQEEVLQLLEKITAASGPRLGMLRDLRKISKQWALTVFT
jgi:uncharacterized protein YjaG (DUF416 family)